MVQLVVFRVDEQRFALPLSTVERLLRAVEITPVPDAPAIMLGAIDVHGRVLPVLDIRRRFRLPRRVLTPDHSFLIAHTSYGSIVLVVDEAEGVIERRDDEITPVASLPLAGNDQFPGVLTLDSGLALIQDLERFLSADETRAVRTAIGDAQDR